MEIRALAQLNRPRKTQTSKHANVRFSKQCLFNIVVDVLKFLPTFIWGVVCIVAIPAYSAIGWIAPVICAVFSTIVSLLATFDIARHLTPNIHQYALVANSTLRGRSTCSKSEPAPAAARTKVTVAAVLSFITVVFTTVFLCIGYAFIEPEEKLQPCGGKCGNCSIDPYCSSWVAAVEEKHRSTVICHPPLFRLNNSSTGSDATFSCLADGYWMMVTSAACIIWQLFLS